MNVFLKSHTPLVVRSLDNSSSYALPLSYVASNVPACAFTPLLAVFLLCTTQNGESGARQSSNTFVNRRGRSTRHTGVMSRKPVYRDSPRAASRSKFFVRTYARPYDAAAFLALFSLEGNEGDIFFFSRASSSSSSSSPSRIQCNMPSPSNQW